MQPFHPDLRRLAQWLPRGLPLTLATARLARFASRWARPLTSTESVRIENVEVPGLGNAPTLRVRVYAPVDGSKDASFVWMHGGGLVLGDFTITDRLCIEAVEALGITVVSVDYRLAIDAPYPAAIDDCEAALRWALHRTGTSKRVAVGGESAGGGLAAALAQRARDADLPVAMQVLIYPMLDDRTTLRPDPAPSSRRLWSAKNNRLGWHTYLGAHCGAAAVAGDAAPARRDDLRGLAPAWIGVGTQDLFYDEDVAYARRLNDAKVACSLEVVDGGFHGFASVAPRAAVVQSFTASWHAALGRALKL
jgi:acetyl esterase/lipase